MATGSENGRISAELCVALGQAVRGILVRGQGCLRAERTRVPVRRVRRGALACRGVRVPGHAHQGPDPAGRRSLESFHARSAARLRACPRPVGEESAEPGDAHALSPAPSHPCRPRGCRAERYVPALARGSDAASEGGRKKKGAGRIPSGALKIGGGGGTADLPLSKQAGLCLHPGCPGCGACYPPNAARRILVPAPAVSCVGQSMSLYRAGLRLALFLPLGVAMPPPGGCRFHRCEPRCHSALAGRGDH